jgi:hypothetical protein
VRNSSVKQLKVFIYYGEEVLPISGDASEFRIVSCLKFHFKLQFCEKDIATNMLMNERSAQ